MNINDEILKASDLAKIGTEEDEIKVLEKDIKSILDYVQKISSIKQTTEDPASKKINLYREDKVTVSKGIYTEAILGSAADTLGGHIKVKKIL